MRAASLLLALAVLAVAPAVGAQDPRAEARERFTRTVELYDEGRFEAALAEFQRAYALAPAAPVLFNIAQVHAAMGHAVAAVDAYERYLAEAGTISEARRAEIDRALATQRARIARLAIDTNALGATIAVDDVEVGTAPLAAPIAVDAGEHVIGVRAPGFESVRRRIRIAGSREETVRIELLPTDSPRASLRVTSPLPGVEVYVDDRPVGLTPFDGTIAVAAGPHRVRGRRDGYLAAEQAVSVEAGAEREVRIALERDPAAPEGTLGRVALAIPDGEWSLTIDGVPQEARGRVIELPVGPHEVVLTVVRRETWRGRVEVPVASTAELEPELEWTPDAVAERGAVIDTHLGVGIGMLAGGAAALGVGIGLWVWNQDEWARLTGEYGRVQQICTDPDPIVAGMCDDAIPPGFMGNLTLYEDHVNLERRTRVGVDAGAVSVMAAGALMVAVGVVTLATMPPRIERRRIDVSLGVGSVSIAGTF